MWVTWLSQSTLRRLVEISTISKIKHVLEQVHKDDAWNNIFSFDFYHLLFFLRNWYDRICGNDLIGLIYHYFFLEKVWSLLTCHVQFKCDKSTLSNINCSCFSSRKELFLAIWINSKKSSHLNCRTTAIFVNLLWSFFPRKNCTDVPANFSK